MKYSTKMLGKMIAAVGILSTSVGVYAQNNAFNNVGNSAAPSLGQVFGNLSSGLGDFGGLMQAVLYVVGVCFSVMTLFKLYKWNKSDGRDATLGGIGVTFLVAVLGFTMPMLISSGTKQVWGNAASNGTIQAPSPSFRP